MIKLFVVASLVALTLAEEPFITLNYHENFGVAQALRIKKAEEARDSSDSRIVGGKPVVSGEQPFLVGLLITLTTGATSVCGASLLSNTRAVTAAHCWWDGFSQGRSLTAVLGSSTLYSGGTRLDTHQVEFHASWNPWSTNNNIAMITLDRVEYSDVISPISLPTGAATYAGTWAVAAGFGYSGEYVVVPAPDSAPQSHQQSQVTLQVITNAACQEVYGSWKVIGSTLCTGGLAGAGLCGGDAGGPLAIGVKDSRLLIGIASFSSPRGCRLGLPSGFTRVTSYLAWINNRL